jgi:hypothetical protein
VQLDNPLVKVTSVVRIDVPAQVMHSVCD